MAAHTETSKKQNSCRVQRARSRFTGTVRIWVRLYGLGSKTKDSTSHAKCAAFLDYCHHQRQRKSPLLHLIVRLQLRKRHQQKAPTKNHEVWQKLCRKPSEKNWTGNFLTNNNRPPPHWSGKKCYKRNQQEIGAGLRWLSLAWRQWRVMTWAERSMACLKKCRKAYIGRAKQANGHAHPQGCGRLQSSHGNFWAQRKLAGSNWSWWHFSTNTKLSLHCSTQESSKVMTRTVQYFSEKACPKKREFNSQKSESQNKTGENWQFQLNIAWRMPWTKVFHRTKIIAKFSDSCICITFSACTSSQTSVKIMLLTLIDLCRLCFHRQTDIFCNIYHRISNYTYYSLT